MHPVDACCVEACVLWGLCLTQYQGWEQFTPSVCDDLAANERSRKTRVELPKCWISSSQSWFSRARIFLSGLYMLPENMFINVFISGCRRHNVTYESN